MCNLKVQVDGENMLEQILNYILLYANTFNTKLFIFINLKSILSRDELIQLYKALNYEKIHILLIENRVYQAIEPYEKIRIIDEDMCELY